MKHAWGVIRLALTTITVAVILALVFKMHQARYYECLRLDPDAAWWYCVGR